MRRSARIGWTAAAALVVSCGIGSYYFTAKIVYGFGDKLDNVSGQVQSHVATIGKLEGERSVLSVSLNTTRTNLARARAKLDQLKSENAKTGAQLDLSISKLVDAVKERDRARTEARSAVWQASKAEAEMQALRTRLAELRAERERLAKERARLVEVFAATGRPDALRPPSAAERVLGEVRADMAKVVQAILPKIGRDGKARPQSPDPPAPTPQAPSGND